MNRHKRIRQHTRKWTIAPFKTLYPPIPAEIKVCFQFSERNLLAHIYNIIVKCIIHIVEFHYYIELPTITKPNIIFKKQRKFEVILSVEIGRTHIELNHFFYPWKPRIENWSFRSHRFSRSNQKFKKLTMR